MVFVNKNVIMFNVNLMEKIVVVQNVKLDLEILFVTRLALIWIVNLKNLIVFAQKMNYPKLKSNVMINWMNIIWITQFVILNVLQMIVPVVCFVSSVVRPV